MKTSHCSTAWCSPADYYNNLWAPQNFTLSWSAVRSFLFIIEAGCGKIKRNSFSADHPSVLVGSYRIAVLTYCTYGTPSHLK